MQGFRNCELLVRGHAGNNQAAWSICPSVPSTSQASRMDWRAHIHPEAFRITHFSQLMTDQQGASQGVLRSTLAYAAVGVQVAYFRDASREALALQLLLKNEGAVSGRALCGMPLCTPLRSNSAAFELLAHRVGLVLLE